MLKPLSMITGLAVLFSGFAFAADNPYTGKWKIDASKSSWSNGKFPKNMSITIDLKFTDDQVTYHSINDTNKDKPMGMDYVAKIDGKAYPLKESARFNQVSMRRIGKNQFEVLEMKDGDVVVGAYWWISPDGKLFTRRGIARGADGSSHEYEEFFDKQ